MCLHPLGPCQFHRIALLGLYNPYKFHHLHFSSFEMSKSFDCNISILSKPRLGDHLQFFIFNICTTIIVGSMVIIVMLVVEAFGQTKWTFQLLVMGEEEDTVVLHSP
jgi:ABC-type uncharacterized transport system permease subunit